MRRVVLITLLTLACVGPGAGAAAPGDPQKRIVPADQAKARSVNIARADLGQGWKAEKPDPHAGDKASSLGRLAFPRIAPQTAAFRVVGTMTANGATLPVTVDLVAVGRHRAVALIFVVSVVQAPDAAGERALARLVAARLAKAFPGGGAGGVSA